MSFSETIFLFFLALIVFGPKKLPEIARQAGKLLAELRRASNEFRSQIESEIAHLEVEKKEVEKAKPAALPTAPPPGAVASLSLNPAQPEDRSHSAQATLATLAPAAPDPAASMPIANESVISDAGAPTAQDSHA